MNFERGATRTRRMTRTRKKPEEPLQARLPTPLLAVAMASKFNCISRVTVRTRSSHHDVPTMRRNLGKIPECLCRRRVVVFCVMLYAFSTTYTVNRRRRRDSSSLIIDMSVIINEEIVVFCGQTRSHAHIECLLIRYSTHIYISVPQHTIFVRIKEVYDDEDC